MSAVAIANNAIVGIQTGDQILFTFSEPIPSWNHFLGAYVNYVFSLNNSHSFQIAYSDSSFATTGYLTFSIDPSYPLSVVVGDIITAHGYFGEDAVYGDDAAGNAFCGTVTITGSFGSTPAPIVATGSSSSSSSSSSKMKQNKSYIYTGTYKKVLTLTDQQKQDAINALHASNLGSKIWYNSVTFSGKTIKVSVKNTTKTKIKKNTVKALIKSTLAKTLPKAAVLKKAKL